MKERRESLWLSIYIYSCFCLSFFLSRISFSFFTSDLSESSSSPKGWLIDRFATGGGNEKRSLFDKNESLGTKEERYIPAVVK